MLLLVAPPVTETAGLLLGDTDPLGVTMRLFPAVTACADVVDVAIVVSAAWAWKGADKDATAAINAQPLTEPNKRRIPEPLYAPLTGKYLGTLNDDRVTCAAVVCPLFLRMPYANSQHNSLRPRRNDKPRRSPAPVACAMPGETKSCMRSQSLSRRSGKTAGKREHQAINDCDGSVANVSDRETNTPQNPPYVCR